MKLNKVLFGIMLTANAFNALAVSQAPVVDVYASNTSSTTLTEQLATLGRKLESRNRTKVNIQRQLDQLQTEVNELRGVTELHTHQLGQVLERQRELYQELDRRVSEALKPVKSAPIGSPDSESISIANLSQNYSSDLTENEAYDRALNLVLKDKRYEQAIPEFRRFNKDFPTSTYAPNAHYWLGQLLFNKGELVEAEKEFLVVVEQYNDSVKRPDALLKLAMVAQKQKKEPKAITLYQQLLKEYPDATSAKLAKPRLQSLLK